MKIKWKAVVMFSILTMMFCAGSVRTEATEPEDLYVKEILKDCTYVRTTLGGGYLGETILYDIGGEQAVVYPNEGEHKTILRDGERATVFYGKYRGKDEHKEYRKLFPELDISFFYTPIAELGLKMSDIREQGYKVLVTEQEQIENFLVPLSFVGVIDNEMFAISGIEILFDEACRPVEVQFQITSDVAEPDRVQYLEKQLSQKFEYTTREVVENVISEIEKEIAQIKPFEEVDVIDYIDELSNVVKVTDEHFLLVLQAQTEELTDNAGWDKRAIFAYLEAVDNKFGQFARGYEGEQITQEEYLEQLDRVYQSAHLIGSDVYTYMFESSQLKPKQKALLVIEQMGGYLDENGMLQLGGGDEFYLGMEPHSVFLEDYAQCVREAYKKKNKSYKRLDDPMIHQFRMYIDRHNIEYVRNNFDGKTDYEKLRNYAKEFEFDLYYGEPSRHHNKVSKDSPFEEQKYDKILTPNRLSEFIVDVETGEFVTEWDVLKTGKEETVLSRDASYKKERGKDRKKVVDTESFNYAPADYVEAHQMLDVLPASPAKEKKFYLENDFKKELKKVWKSPEKKVYQEKYRKPSDYLK